MATTKELLVLVAICVQVIANNENENGKSAQSSDFDAGFSGNSGDISLTSPSVADALINVDKRQYPQLFDTLVSSSIDSIQSRVAPRESPFSPNRFGFNPIASQGFAPLVKSAKIIDQPNGKIKVHQQQSKLVYDIETIHDPVYKVYKPEENNQGEEILAALKNNPTVANYFKPSVTNVEVSHPIKYRQEDLNENIEIESNYKAKPYILGSPRIRRYTGNGKRRNVRKDSGEDEEESDNPYDYDSVYASRPKAFESDSYSAYKEDPKKDAESDADPYGYDSGYDHKEYERIKELSEKQAAEIKQNPGNCKEVQKDGMTCMTCKDPKTGGNYESCSYVQQPKNNKYAYSKEKKFDSNDEPDVPENEEKSEQPNNESAKYQRAGGKEDAKPTESAESEEKQSSNYKKEKSDEPSNDKYKAYYVRSSNPKSSEEIKGSADHDESKEDSVARPYNYKKAIPGFYSDNEPKKDVEHVLAEFKKKDRSACKKVHKNGMTCFQCIDKNGLKHEECMYVSESAPKRSHLAYQELKEFTSKPTTLNGENNEGAESQTVKTTNPIKTTPALVENKVNGRKKQRRKLPSTAATAASNTVTNSVPATTAPLLPTARLQRIKRSDVSEAEKNAQIVDVTHIAPPEEFAGDSSHGAYWAETMPRYSASLGVTLPEYMLSRSEHETSFDELVAGA